MWLQSRFALQKQNCSTSKMTGERKVSRCLGEWLRGSGCLQAGTERCCAWWGTLRGPPHSLETCLGPASQRPAVLLVSSCVPRPDLHFHSPGKTNGLLHPQLMAGPHLCGQHVTHGSVRPRDRKAGLSGHLGAGYAAPSITG